MKDLFRIHGSVAGTGGVLRRLTHHWEVSWEWIFGALTPTLVQPTSRENVRKVLVEALPLPVKTSDPQLNSHDFDTIEVQMQALGLVNLVAADSRGGILTTWWYMTDLGKRRGIEIRAVRAGKREPDTVATPTGGQP
jgi:hypothetical protein